MNEAVGDGGFGVGGADERPAEQAEDPGHDTLHQRAEAAGRDPKSISITIFYANPEPAAIEALESGAHRFTVLFDADPYAVDEIAARLHSTGLAMTAEAVERYLRFLSAGGSKYSGSSWRYERD